MTSSRQAAVTVASGPHAEQLDKTFSSFALNPFLELHAFIIGDTLPTNRVPGVTYHLKDPDPSFQHPMRDLYYRRFLFIEETAADFAVLVDNTDVLCMQAIPHLPNLLRGAAFGGCVEHNGGQLIDGQGYTSSYFNAGVTFWDVGRSKVMRREIVDRGRARFRSVEDQLSLNEVIHTLHYDEMVILPCQYNFRACLAPFRLRGWPTVANLDGVRIYHNSHCVEDAKRLAPPRPKAILPPLREDARPLNRFEKSLRRLQSYFTNP